MIKKWDTLVTFLIAASFAVNVFLAMGIKSPYDKRQNDNYQATAETCYELVRPYGIYIGTKEDQQKTGQVERDRYYEICQQVRSAKAAEYAADVANWQYRIGIFGFIGVVIATFFAARAAHHTKRQADIAESAYQSIDRPYVVETVGDEKSAFTPGSGPPIRTRLNFENFGHEPAVMMQVAAHLVISSGPPDDRVLGPNHLATGNDVLVAGGKPKSITVFADKSQWNAHFDSLRRREADLWLAGEFFYRDMSGAIYAVPFEWVFSTEHNAFIKRAKPKNSSKNHHLEQHLTPPPFDTGWGGAS